MSLNYPKPGANHVPSFQISGLPFVTRSAQNEITTTPLRIRIPYVTRFFVIGNNSAGDLRVGFTENGTKGAETANYFTVKPFTSGALRYEIRCKELWFMADSGQASGFELLAGLSSVESTQFPVLSGTAHTYGFNSGSGVTTSTWPGVG